MADKTQIFQNRVAAVTGAGSGIGRALSLELAARGCDLALSDIDASSLAETAEQARSRGRRVTTQSFNVGERAAMENWAQGVAAEHGSVHFIFNNAGVALSGTVAELSVEDYEWVMQINFWGVVYGTKAFLPLLEASGFGHVINISSIFGITSQPLMSGYNASKFAVRGFTESLCQDLELTNSCVRATVVMPGGIKTNIAKAARTGAGTERVTGMSGADTTREFERMFITSPAVAANTILGAVARNQRRVLVGPDAHVIDLLARVAPVGYQRVTAGVVKSRSRKPA